MDRGQMKLNCEWIVQVRTISATHFGDANGSCVVAVGCCRMARTQHAAEDAGQTLHGHGAVHGTGRGKRHPANSGWGIVVTNGFHHWRHGGHQHAQKSCSTDRGESKLNCEQERQLYYFKAEFIWIFFSSFVFLFFGIRTLFPYNFLWIGTPDTAKRRTLLLRPRASTSLWS